MDKDSARHASAEAEAESGVLTDDMIRILEAGLPKYGQNAAGAEMKASGADDGRRRYETNGEEPEPEPEQPKAKPTDMTHDISDGAAANDGVSSWTIKFPEEIGGEGVTAGPPPDGWWR
jgi:hypothetical protein